MKKITSPATILLLLAMLSLAALKLWLTSAQALTAIVPSGLDDRLYLVLADHLSKGDWLGPYNRATLAKGPFYPMFIAASYLAGIPLLLSQHLFYIFACGLLTIAIKPLVKTKTVLLLIYALILFNPVTYNTDLLRVLRQGIYDSLALSMYACLIGLFSYRHVGLRRMLYWAVGAGLALAGAWLCREETIALLPSVLLLLACTLVALVRKKPVQKLKCAICVIPLLIPYLSSSAVSLINYYKYGIYCVVEFNRRQFVGAVSALESVRHMTWRRYVLVPPEVRKRVYRVSRAFSEISPYLEGSVGKYWNEVGSYELKLPSKALDIPGMWFVWALRESVSAAGYGDARAAMNYYGRVLSEISSAFEGGRLEKDRKGFSIIPPWRHEYVQPIRNDLRKAARMLMWRDGISVRNAPSLGWEGGFRFFRRVTRERLAPVREQMSGRDAYYRADSYRLDVLEKIGGLYRTITPWMILLSLISYLYCVAMTVVRRRISVLFVIATSALVALGVQVIILVYLNVSLFPTMSPKYFSLAHLFLLVFCSFSLLSFRPSYLSSGMNRFS